jgi:2-(1,2-epoxy-1,2-dihydrophenyl)acetyl-CoA isomerase
MGNPRRHDLEFETLLYAVDDGVATLTLNRPQALNAFSSAMQRELAAAIPMIAADDNVLCVILTGAGRAFCAGGDMNDMADADPSPLCGRNRLRSMLHNVFAPLIRMETPVIAAVNGVAVGAGFNLALAADIALVDENAVMSQIFVQVGLVPDTGGLHLLTRLIGLNRAKELCFTGRKLTGREAAEYGLVNRALPATELMPAARHLARQIADGPAAAIGMTKSLLNLSATASFDEMMEFEAYAQAIALSTTDHREGVQAFREKRRPEFGRRS